MVTRIVLLAAAIVLTSSAVASADATERVVNGGFEDGTDVDAPPWTLTNSFTCTTDSCFYGPASGARYVGIGGGTSVGPFGVQSQGGISQALKVPESPAILTFKLRRPPGDSDDADMEMKVTLGGLFLRNVDNTTGDFETVSITLPAETVSPSNQLLEFTVTCSNTTDMTKNCRRMDLDDVSIVSGPPPEPPALTGTDPASPADNTTPKVRGSVGAGAPSQIRLYSNATCTGTPAATGSPADFTGAGIPVAVPEGSATTFTARASNLAGDSGCSNSITYVEVGPPGPPLVARPKTGLSAMKSKFAVGNLGILVLGKATSPPIASTSQMLTVSGASSSAKRRKKPLVIGKGKTAIPAGATKKLKLTLNRRGKRLLRKRKKLRGQLTIVAKGPTGLTDTVTKSVKLVLKRPRR